MRQTRSLATTFPSEDNLQRELPDARIVRPPGTPESSRADVVGLIRLVRRLEVHPVKDIEKFRPELQTQPFAHPWRLSRGHFAIGSCGVVVRSIAYWLT